MRLGHTEREKKSQGSSRTLSFPLRIVQISGVFFRETRFDYCGPPAELPAIEQLSGLIFFLQFPAGYRASPLDYNKDQTLLLL